MKSTNKPSTRKKTAAPASRAARPVASKRPTPAKPVASKRSAPAQPAASKLPAPTKREIAVRAYEIYAKSGHQPGREVEFWLEAERQLHRGLKAK